MAVVVLVWCFAFRTWEGLRADVGIPDALALPSSDPYSLICGGTYVAIGWWLSQGRADATRPQADVALAAVGFAAIAAWHFWVGDVWYDNPCLLLLVVPLYRLLLRGEWSHRMPRRLRGCFAACSRASFGIYLCHMMVVTGILGAFPALPWPVTAVLLAVCTGAVSGAVVAALWHPAWLRLVLWDAK